MLVAKHRRTLYKTTQKGERKTFMRCFQERWIIFIFVLSAYLWVVKQGVFKMVVLNKIYTKTGDAGTTALGDGVRAAKYDLRVEAYGTVDELNAVLGVARLNTRGVADEALAHIQNDLFDLGADLCRPGLAGDAGAEYPPLRMTSEQVGRLEAEIDEMNADLGPLRSFVLPGGSALAAHMHVCRTVSRRAERRAVELAQEGDVNAHATRYLNRLSDWFFCGRAVCQPGRCRGYIMGPRDQQVRGFGAYYRVSDSC